MKLLVVPDIHEAHNLDAVDAAIRREAPDRTIFLGDYFDQWHDTPAHAERAAEWLKRSLALPNRIHLLGNHDVRYWFPENENTVCSGFTEAKLKRIQRVLTGDDWERLRLTHWEENLLFCHAGWTREFSKAPDATTPPSAAEQQEFLEQHEREAWQALREDKHHWIWDAGRARGGRMQLRGGLVWCDWHEFKPIAGIHQILGHTPGNLATVLRGAKSCNVCLDTTNRFDGVQHCLVIEEARTILVKTLDGAEVRRIEIETS